MIAMIKSLKRPKYTFYDWHVRRDVPKQNFLKKID